MCRASAGRRGSPKSSAATTSRSTCCARCSCRSPSTRTSSSRRSTPSWRRGGPGRRAASATARSSSCRWRTASASAPASAAPRRFDVRPTMSAIGYLLSDDLIFTSRVTGTARALGLSVRAARSVDGLLELAREQPPACVIVDLAHPGLSLPDLIRQLGELGDARPRVVAYGSHVDAAGLRAAREAGCDLVLPRSKFVEDLPGSLPAWLAAPAE